MNEATVGALAGFLEELAPPAWAESWDNVGLQVGSPRRPVRSVLVALELTGAVVEEAVAVGAQLMVVHHPAIFRPLRALRTDTPAGRRLERLVQVGISLYAAHTNLDQAEGGTNDLLAAAVGLREPEVLSASGEEKLLKLVVFVPQGHVETVRTALAEAGAGHIGNYSHCTFQTEGTGTFLPLEGTRPFLGEKGKLEHVQEYRLETILPEGISRRAVAALIRAHPYEEVAYDLYPLANPGRARGHGRVGQLAQPVTVQELAGRVKTALGAEHLRVVAGEPDRRVERVAVGAGAGGSLVGPAAERGAQALVTGDVDYHDAQEALDLGLAVIDPGHFATERLIVPALAEYLRRRTREAGLAVEILEAQGGRDPFLFL
jgi:dinuclear metal center YbgI/SA1388 family protein